MKKQLSKEVTFSKIEKISLTAKADHMTQNWKSMLKIGLRNSLLYCSVIMVVKKVNRKDLLTVQKKIALQYIMVSE